ncbi:FtsX-like permease family protein [Flavobacteriaceae bacterium Ap0902]|nr:FtsX-like permease family protein [Flavobacteriaceae bacterium Ap0902]
MNFSWYFAKKIGFGKTSKNHLSRTIIRIGQFAVAIGIIVALVTLSTGIGARKEIKQKLADFNGHITVRPYNSNLSFNSDSISLPKNYYPDFPLEEVEHIQAVASKNGIIRTADAFDGVVLKGVDENFDQNRFNKFLQKGDYPVFGEAISDEVLVSQNIANNFYLDVDSTFLMVFVNERQTNAKPIYRKFKVAGIYATDIAEFDDLYVIGDIRQVQRINQWDHGEVGGFELFVHDIESDLDFTKEEVNSIIGYNLLAESATDLFRDIEDWIHIFDTNIFIILFIMLIVVIINMVMILLILILERTNSIGILKTLGASNLQVRKIFVNYALFIMIPGMLAGNIIAIGLLMIQKYTGIIQLPPENYFIKEAPVYLTLEMIIYVNLGSILISALALWLPSLLIQRISPSKALKIG